MKRRAMKKWIPKGYFCRGRKGCCKWVCKIKNKENQNNVFCKYLNKGDWDFEQIGLPWYLVKECGVKTIFYKYDEYKN